MKDVFGEKLEVAASASNQLPSPEQLKGKILIKVTTRNNIYQPR